MRAIAYEEIAFTNGAAVHLDNGGTIIPNIADEIEAVAEVYVNGNTVCFLKTGATPTTATKLQAAPQSTIILDNVADMLNFKAIGATGSGTLAVTYYA